MAGSRTFPSRPSPLRRPRPDVRIPASALAITIIIAACGSGGHARRKSTANAGPATKTEIGYARCMTSHGARLIATGGGGFQGPGVNMTLRSTQAAQTVCAKRYPEFR